GRDPPSSSPTPRRNGTSSSTSGAVVATCPSRPPTSIPASGPSPATTTFPSRPATARSCPSLRKSTTALQANGGSPLLREHFAAVITDSSPRSSPAKTYKHALPVGRDPPGPIRSL